MANDNINFQQIANHHLLFSSLFLKILDKEKQITPFHLNSVQKQMLKQMTDRTLVLKGRQMGISTLMQSLLYRLSITRTIAGLVLSHSDTSTQAFRRMFTRFNQYMPDEFRPEFGYNNRTIVSFPQTDSEIVVATAGGSGDVGRGFSFSHIHFSEYAFVNDPQPMLAGAIQSGNPKVVIESTANGTDNHFYDLCMQAYHEPESTVWKLLFFPWFMLDSYVMPVPENFKPNAEEESLMQVHKLTHEQLVWRRHKIKELGRRLFNQEYPSTVEEAFLTSGVGYFNDIPHLEEIFVAPLFSEYNSDRKYIAGLDLGRAKDYTALSIFDKAGYEVDLFRINQASWNTIKDRIIEKLNYWNVDTLWVENNNVGAVISEDIAEMIENHPELNTLVQSFNMNSKTKPQIVNYFHRAINDKEIYLLPDANAKREIYSFTATQTQSGRWKFEASAGHDDTVIARMLANYGLIMSDIKLLEFV